MLILKNQSQELFFRILEAAERVTFATAPSAALRTAPNNRSVNALPPKKKARTMSKRMMVRGMASMGEVNQSKTSSKAATPRATKAHVGMEAE